MTAAAETGMTDQAAEAVTLARDTADQIAEVRALVAEVARQAELAAGWNVAPKAVLWWLIDANRAIVSWPRTGTRVTP